MWINKRESRDRIGSNTVWPGGQEARGLRRLVRSTWLRLKKKTRFDPKALNTERYRHRQHGQPPAMRANA